MRKPEFRIRSTSGTFRSAHFPQITGKPELIFSTDDFRAMRSSRSRRFVSRVNASIGGFKPDN